jgi:PAS domain S-box-containing protein
MDNCIQESFTAKENIARVLIVDNDVGGDVSALLQPCHYNVTSTTGGADAIAMIETHPFDLILLDLELSDINGEEVLHYLRKNPKTRHVPVLMMMKKHDAATVGNLIKQGANEFLLKPFVPEELLLKIDFWIDYQRKQIEILCEQRLLQEYKEAIDRSTIVSKTDKHGYITFVNDKFCEISGYSSDELLGQPHNIVRHPDMPQEVFAELWKTILSGQTWEGIVKNRKKEGSFYWVHTVINPIIDLNGEIVEFIGIRNDITAIQEEKERIRDTLGIATTDYIEARHLANEYEAAMDSTWAVIRTDTENIITYANKTFCSLSGFTHEELIGQECRILRDKRHIDNHDCDNLQNALGRKERVKIRFHNVSKNKEIYYVDASVIPIVDAQGTTKEHLHLMCNITEIIQLHQEIEQTQQEIIYRMGEIGESRSKETGNHVRRVAEYARLLAKKAGFDEEESSLIADASPMHDIGKVAIPDAILHKPGSLNDDEWAVMRSHSAIGHKVLAGSQRPLLNAASIIAHQHHEKYDGNGYPHALSGEDIHIYARIVAIADVFDALGSDRIYKKAWPLEKIVALFEEERGNHFDPLLVELFLNHLDEFVAIRDRYTDDIEISKELH